jgi:thiamine-monophosphate kinase
VPLGRQSKDRQALIERHVRPRPQLDAGQAAVHAGVRCGIDVSDGLVQDLGHIGAASGCGAMVQFDDIPVDQALAAQFPNDARMLACTGGEDYELVLVGPRAAIDATSAALATPLQVIGEMTPDAGHGVRVLDGDGDEVSFGDEGWDHMKVHPWTSR